MDLEKAPTLHEEDSKVTLTIRLIMQGKEVGSIIGKKGEIVKRFREESGAKINISDGSCPERIVTVTGNTSAIFKAFTLICKKFEEFNEGGGGGSRAPITLRLIVPASQCGSLIGKGGSKIKEIRDVTGANIQVASEMLPNSTERAVTISGTCDAITQCIYHICCVMLESPPKGATIPYRPKPNVAGPVILAGGQAYTIQGNYAVPAQDAVCAPVFPVLEMKPPLVGALPPAHLLPPLHEHHLMGGLAKSPLAGLAALGLGGLGPANTGGLNPAALAALAGSQLRTSNQTRNTPATNQQSHEMTVPNELIGCIIGKGGTKIAEIRQISGAMIRISNCEEREGGSTDRTITISGNPDSVALAQYLINMSVELQKANLEGSASGAGGSGSSPLASAIPLAQLLSKSGALGALSSLSALGGLSDLLAGAAPPVQTTGVHRSHKSFARRADDEPPSKTSKERNKYSPY
ncbi:poly(rC)-binding protein 3 isoform X2 [Vanessa atalanta]|uniref:poly(rC)-binding protein 3 isoform X2 n=1 Tax=Vanessa atalanta TaxID=42275 RepID=UPI000E7771B7|nr:poly(rC)-binding protein 3 isoform X2 [Vanessa tameamea]XP_047529080.1 poly(rC)-binding protein 3 isoform X2 [Vanessa atalanta]